MKCSGNQTASVTGGIRPVLGSTCNCAPDGFRSVDCFQGVQSEHWLSCGCVRAYIYIYISIFIYIFYVYIYIYIYEKTKTNITPNPLESGDEIPLRWVGVQPQIVHCSDRIRSSALLARVCFSSYFLPVAWQRGNSFCGRDQAWCGWIASQSCKEKIEVKISLIVAPIFQFTVVFCFWALSWLWFSLVQVWWWNIRGKGSMWCMVSRTN